ncbi:MAG TPA: STAS domain-containing protein [Bryobacteraceae bacterium]
MRLHWTGPVSGRDFSRANSGVRRETALALHYGLIMSLDIRESIREGIVVLSLKGRLTVGESNSVRDKVNECAASGHVNVILDLTDIDYVDSTGLGTMVICFTSLKKLGGALKLVNPNKRNVELLLLTKLHTVFQVFTEVQDAVNSFFPGREIKHFDILQFVKEQEREEDEEAEKTSKPK